MFLLWIPSLWKAIIPGQRTRCCISLLNLFKFHTFVFQLVNVQYFNENISLQLSTQLHFYFHPLIGSLSTFYKVLVFTHLPAFYDLLSLSWLECLSAPSLQTTSCETDCILVFKTGALQIPDITVQWQTRFCLIGVMNDIWIYMCKNTCFHVSHSTFHTF